MLNCKSPLPLSSVSHALSLLFVYPTQPALLDSKRVKRARRIYVTDNMKQSKHHACCERPRRCPYACAT
ncbi:hypothetical protein CCMA1212_002157 [Trichoderma ghanense]|uniref:Secreted protein n=1 Tax=Trichoderma ghanense TaxID=65468 RepID=A0ABY2HCR4_9HYPO